jgi:hypothetical protein
MSLAIKEVRNAKSLNASNTRMDVEIKHPKLGWIPYTLDVSDTDQTIRNDDLLTLIGSNFEVYVEPTQEEVAAKTANDVRGKRNLLLSISDWTQVSDVPEQTKEKWTQYRQALRDLPEQQGFPFDVVWPTSPQ